MLEFIQKRFQTAILAVLVALLSAVFILQFNGPQSTGCGATQSSFAARVHSHTITRGEFRAAFVLGGFNRFSPEQARSMGLRQHTLDGLVERELLAHEAERLGFTADATEVMRQVAVDQIILMSPPVDAPVGYPGPEIPVSFEDRDGNFSAEYMRRTIQGYLRRSMEEFATWQVRERLAAQVRATVTASVFVSPEEIRSTYVRETERATISYVRYAPTYYRERVDVSDAAVTEWMEGHADELDEEYQRQRHRYTGLDPQVRASHILIKAASDVSETDRAAARARATELLRRARAGEDFGTLAREHSEDTGSARADGDLGWNVRGRMVAPFDDAQFALEPGEITEELVETTFGYHIIKVTGRREGDVPEAEAKRELADGLYRRARAGDLAGEEAQRALAYLREGHTLEELDERLLHDWQEVAPAEPAPVPEGDAVEPTEAPTEPEPAEEEPAERDPLAPQVRESRSFGRTETPIPGAFDGGPLTRAVFERSLEEPLPEEPIQLGSDYFVFQLTERTEATDEGFTAEVQERIEASLLEDKRGEALRVFVRRLREEAREAGALRIDESILRYGDEAEEDEGEGEDEGEEEEEEEEAEEEEASLWIRPRGRRA